MTTTSGICRGRAREWDLDQATAGQIKAAIRLCGQCPLRAACGEHLLDRVAAGDPPIASVQAGIAFGHDGKPLAEDQLQHLLKNRRAERPLPAEARRLLGVA